MNSVPYTDLVLPETFAPPRCRRPVPPASDRPMVLLAEDDPDLRMMMGSMLRGEGWDVLAASDGEDLLNLLSAASRGEMRAPDALVLDVRMPCHGGDEIVGALRRTGWSQPIVLITGFASASVRARAHEDGASAVLEKPVDPRPLAALLFELLDESHTIVEDLASEDRAPQTLRSPSQS